MGQKAFDTGFMLPDDILHHNYTPMGGAPTLEGSPKNTQTYISSFASNSSRNLMIDQLIEPGPYNEVLPCEDLCYSLLQSCPSSFGFGCPYRGRGLEAGYGTRNTSDSSTITCNYPGAVYDTSAADKTWPLVYRALVIAAFAALLVGLA